LQYEDPASADVVAIANADAKSRVVIIDFICPLHRSMPPAENGCRPVRLLCAPQANKMIARAMRSKTHQRDELKRASYRCFGVSDCRSQVRKAEGQALVRPALRKCSSDRSSEPELQAG
jgi:hypothetical protein